MAPQVVIDATKSHLECLEPYTHEDGSWSHHLVEDAEDPADGPEDPWDGVKALLDDEEALDGLEKD